MLKRQRESEYSGRDLEIAAAHDKHEISFARRRLTRTVQGRSDVHEGVNEVEVAGARYDVWIAAQRDNWMGHRGRLTVTGVQRRSPQRS